MRFVKKENDFRLVEVTDFGQMFKQLRHQPQQKSEYSFGFSTSLSAAKMLMMPRPDMS